MKNILMGFDIIVTNVENPLISITGHLTLESYSGNGVNVIKEALVTARDKFKDKVEDVEIKMKGLQNTLSTLSLKDYKTAESVLRDIAEMAIAHVQNNEGKGSFKRS